MSRWLLLAVAAVLWMAADPATVGLIADGRQMIFTAVAITEAGSLGQARSRDLTFPRPGGDSVSRYGLGMSFAQLPAAALAPTIEEARGAGRSQWLFLAAPFVFVLASGVAAARAVRVLGGTRRAANAAFLLATLASPLGAYATMDLSEPLQAFALTAAFAAAAGGAALAAGVFVGVAVLTKSSLLFIAPISLAPLLGRPARDQRRLARRALIGFAPIAAVWLYFEVTRFGRPFAGYMGEGFTHPFLDGAWRLVVGPDKGLLLYYPAAAIAVVAVVRSWNERDVRYRASLLATVIPTVLLLGLAAPWWAWHGVDGWGPRLLIPGVPLLAVAAAIEADRWRPALRYAAFALCLLANLPPLLQHPTPVVRYMWSCAWPTGDPIEAARVPPFARRELNGAVAIPPDQVLAKEPAASPFLLLPWFFAAAHADPQARTDRLNSPPWLERQPAIRPVPPLSEGEAEAITHRDFAVYDAALRDQVMRLQQVHDTAGAIVLAEKLERLAPDGFADALLLESYRLTGRKQDAVAWLTQLPTERRLHPAINIVLALWDRDEGKEQEARALLRSSADSFPGTPVQTAVNAPLTSWPPDFASITADASLAIR